MDLLLQINAVNMKTRLLGDIEVSEIGMGCMAFSHGYGKIPEESYSIEAIRGAYKHGCNFFDTAEIYSPNLMGRGSGTVSDLWAQRTFWFLNR